MRAKLPENEPERLAVLASYGVLDTPSEQRFDDLALLAATLCGTPIALISLVDRERQWFKSKIGLDVCETPRDMAFCAHAILQPERLLVVPDTLLDPRFIDNALVTGEPGIRFYAGAPVTANGAAIGTICVIDRIPRQLSPAQCDGLRALARQVSGQLELGRTVEVQHQLRKVADAATKSMKDSKERLQGIFDSALDAIVSIDTHGNITAFNAAAERLFGIDANGVIGRQMAEVIVPPAYRAAHNAGMERFNRTGNATVLGRRIEITACRADGSEFPVELAISSIRTSKGNEFTAYIRDISERRVAELQLASARDSAELANRAKGQFLANMSHEIRTPLNGIIGLSEIALEDDSTEDPREMLELINDLAGGLLDIVNSILDFSKIESTGVELHPRPFRPRAALGDALRALAVRARRKGLAFEYEQDASVPSLLLGDAGVIRQIVFNLVGNSIKFTTSGFVRTMLKFDGMVGPQAALTIVVRDTGIGIAANELETIFEAFAQSDLSDARAYGGTGLGLAITRQLVAALGGRMTVESTLGVGSTFSVSLLVDVAEESHAGETAPGSAEPPPCPSGQHVLVLDDNATNRLVASSWLRRHGYRTTEAESAIEALGLVAVDTPDLMLVDIQMPGMSGFDFLNAVRASPGAAASAPAVALTAHAMGGDRERFLGLGMEGYIAKPFSADTLLAEVGRVLGLRQTATAAVAGPQSSGRFARALAGLDGDEELFFRLAAKASESFVVHSRRITEMAQKDEWRQLGELAHQLKGSWDLYAKPGDEGLPGELMSALAGMDYPNARLVTTRMASALRQAARDLEAWMEERGA